MTAAVPAPFDPLRQIAADSAAIAAASAGRLEAPIEFCPEWAMADLLWHVIAVQSFWEQIVRRRLVDPALVARPSRPDDAVLGAMLVAGAAQLTQALQDADPAAPVWTWASQQDVGFILRHQVQEAAVHRWDAEHAAGRSPRIAPEVAGDAVDEFLSFSLRPLPRGGIALAAPLQVRTTDTGQAWVLRPADGRLTVARGSDRTAANRVEGPADDVLLWLYGRRPLSALAAAGDPAAAVALLVYASTS